MHDHLNTGLGPLKLLDITQKSLDGFKEFSVPFSYCLDSSNCCSACQLLERN